MEDSASVAAYIRSHGYREVADLIEAQVALIEAFLREREVFNDVVRACILAGGGAAAPTEQRAAAADEGASGRQTLSAIESELKKRVENADTATEIGIGRRYALTELIHWIHEQRQHG